jgi:20S proteasome subunit beta 2
MINPTTTFTLIIIVLSDAKLSYSSPYSSPSHPLLLSMNQNNDIRHNNHRLNGGRAMITPVRTGLDNASFILDLDSRFEVLDDEFDSSSLSVVTDDIHQKISSYTDMVCEHDEIRLAIHNIHRSCHEQNDDIITNAKRTYLKTGTTIVGVQTRESIILAADTRATEGSVVADTRCEKVHQLCQNIWCCGAGTSGDLDALTRKVRYTFLLRTKIRDTVGNDGPNTNDSHAGVGMPFQSEEEIEINQNLGKAGIATVCHFIREELTKGRGQIGANLVLGGVDPFTDQPVLVAIHPHGSIDVVPYTALGSGGLSAMGVLESRYHVDMTMEEGIELVKSAVLAGIKNDLGSGSQVCIDFFSRSI